MHLYAFLSVNYCGFKIFFRILLHVGIIMWILITELLKMHILQHMLILRITKWIAVCCQLFLSLWIILSGRYFPTDLEYTREFVIKANLWNCIVARVFLLFWFLVFKLKTFCSYAAGICYRIKITSSVYGAYLALWNRVWSLAVQGHSIVYCHCFWWSGSTESYRLLRFSDLR